MHTTQEVSWVQKESILPEVGIHQGVHMDEYLGWPAVSQSVLKEGLAVSWKRAKAILDGRLSFASTAMDLGSQIHCRLLEPKKYRERYAIAEPCSGIVHFGKPNARVCGVNSSWRHGDRWYCGTHAKQVPNAERAENIMSPERATKNERIVESLFENDIIHLLRQHGGAEVAMLAVIEQQPVKGRVDKLVTDMPFSGGKSADVLIDIKKITSGRGTHELLQKDIRQYGYDFQAAWYLRIYETLTSKDARWCWVFVEDDEPFDCAVYWASKHMLAVGRHKVDIAWARYLRCREEDAWPGYQNKIGTMSPADWEITRYGLS